MRDFDGGVGAGPLWEMVAAGVKGQQSDLSKIVKLIMERDYDPVIIFSFSKR